jgi:hypothetical protein
MSQTAATVRVMPTHPSQGEWVTINASDFDPAVHQLYGTAPEPDASPKPAEMPKRRGRPPKYLNQEPNDGNR